MVQGVGFRVKGLGFGVQGLLLQTWFRVEGFRSRVESLVDTRSRVEGWSFHFPRLRFQVQALGILVTRLLVTPKGKPHLRARIENRTRLQGCLLYLRWTPHP